MDAAVDLVVVMGVSGVGKTSVAEGIAEATGRDFAEGDDLHPPENVEKMHAGEPLTDEDRWPWLRAVAGWLQDQAEAGASGVITCSALKRSYRDLLRDGRPEVRFCHLVGDEELIAGRLSRRTDHFMPPGLLASQLGTLEPLGDDEPGVAVPVDGSPEEVLDRALDALGLGEDHRFGPDPGAP